MTEAEQKSPRTVKEDVDDILADRPEPKSEPKHYPSYERTPAVACRLEREYYDYLKLLAEEIERSTALILKAILQDWIEKNRAHGKEEINRLVTRSIEGL